MAVTSKSETYEEEHFSRNLSQLDTTMKPRKTHTSLSLASYRHAPIWERVSMDGGTERGYVAHSAGRKEKCSQHQKIKMSEVWSWH